MGRKLAQSLRKDQGMSAITGISSSNYYTANAGSIYKNPTESAFAEKTTAQVRGTDAGTENMKSAQAVTKVADGALEGVNDYLQRIREIGVKAKNTATYNDDDRAAMQAEVEQLKKGIADIAEGTTFNEHKIMNGSRGDMEVAADGNGSYEKVSGGNATLKSLGIEDFDVTKDFDLKTIDNAMEKVSSQRGNLGAGSNRLDHAMAYNQLSSYNNVASFKEDDLQGMVNRVNEMKKNRLFETAQMMMQQKQQENQRIQTQQLFA